MESHDRDKLTDANLPAVIRDVELDRLARLGQWLALSESGSDSEKARGAAAALRLYYCAELGLPPLAATKMSVIKGQVVCQAELLRALATRGGFRVVRSKGSNDKTCTAVLVNVETGEAVGETTFTFAEAQKAGLVKPKSNWETYPARMLWARASKYVIQDYAPELAFGIILADEATEIFGTATWDDDPVDKRSPDPSGPVDNSDDLSEFGVPAGVQDDIPGIDAP